MKSHLLMICLLATGLAAADRLAWQFDAAATNRAATAVVRCESVFEIDPVASGQEEESANTLVMFDACTCFSLWSLGYFDAKSIGFAFSIK